MPSLFALFLSLILMPAAICISPELRAGNWRYKNGNTEYSIIVYKYNNEYKAYINNVGIYTLKRNNDNTFSPIAFDNTCYIEQNSLKQAKLALKNKTNILYNEKEN